MKTLYLMRHAKSSWDFPELSDHDRPLNSRGRHDAALMGKQLLSREFCPDLILVSTAVRALNTATLVARELNYDLEKIHTNGNIYHAGKEELLEIIRDVPEGVASLLFVAHNFAISELANWLVEDSVPDMPTAGVVAIEFPVETWAELMPLRSKLLFTDKPRNYKDKNKDKEKDKKEKDKDKKGRKEEEQEPAE